MTEIKLQSIKLTDGHCLLHQCRSSLLIDNSCQVKMNFCSLQPNLLLFLLDMSSRQNTLRLLTLFSIPFELITLISSCKLMPISTSEHFLLCSTDFLALFDPDTVLFSLMSSRTEERVAFGAERSLCNANFGYAYDICSGVVRGKREKHPKYENRGKGFAGWACQTQ